ncbi:ephrin-A3 [Panthera tigris]|uniref:ephrin-A3 n=1 Tax=Panthera tigris TaxID=9694 RepID=UPI001C6F6826|nr:ephrin-A3 [Panthera tigris]
MNVLTRDRDPCPGLPNPSPGNSRPAGRDEARAAAARGGQRGPPPPHAARSAPERGGARRERARGGASGARPEGGGKGWGRGLRLGGRRRRRRRRRRRGAGRREAGSAGLSRGAAAAAAPGMAAPLLLLLLLVPVPLLPLLAQGPGGALGNRHAVYWNSSNQHLRREGYTVQVNVNDYLDIYCPHYNSSGVGPGAGPGPGGGAEQYVLYMVSRAGYRTCNASQGFKRWECNRPHAPHSPIKFSEKFQRYSAFSLGYEFHAGHEYYYISTPTHSLHWKCLRMKVFVCCASTSHSGEKPAPTLPQFTMGPHVRINVLEDFEGENPQVPKLEKSVSGTSPKREHLPLAAGIAFFLMTLLAS